MSLPDLSLLAHGAAPTAPSAAAIVATVGFSKWIRRIEEVLGRIVHTVPDDAKEGTEPKPPYVAEANPAGMPGAVALRRFRRVVTYLTTNFRYVDWSTIIPMTGREKADQLLTFLTTKEPFSFEFWPTLDETRKELADRHYPGFDQRSIEVESHLATL